MNSRNSSLTCFIRDRAASAPSLTGVGRDSQRKTNTRDTDLKLGGSRFASNPEPDPASNVTATGKHLLQSWIVRSDLVENTHWCRLMYLYSWKTNSYQALHILHPESPESRCVWLGRYREHKIRAKWNLERLWITERLYKDALNVLAPIWSSLQENSNKKKINYLFNSPLLYNV